MIVQDIRTRTTHFHDGVITITYGYCKCGREVTKGQYTRCPLCMKLLEWGDGTEKRRSEST